MAYDELRTAYESLERRFEQQRLQLAEKTQELEQEVLLRTRFEGAFRQSEPVIARLREQHADDAEAQGLLDTAPDAIVVVESHGRITFVNVQAESLFGYTRSELVGQPLERLIPERLRRNHCGYVNSFFANPGARAMGSRLELFGRRRDGTQLPIEVSLSPLRTARGTTVSASIRDISERRAKDAAAKLAAERLASAVESIQDAFALFDSDDRLVLCNSVYRRLIGESLPGPIVATSYERLLDAWIDDIAFADDAERARFRAARLQHRHDEPATTFELRMRDGRSLRVVDRRTAEGGIVKTISDVTDDVRLADALREARVAADAANGAKSEFLSSMSHELRTPLNAILGFAQLLKRDKKEPLSARHQDRVAHILSGGEHLLRLIDDILDLSRIEARGVSMSTEPVSALDVLGEVRATLEPMAAALGIRIELEAPSVLPQVAVDKTRYAQILMNFGSNALKYNRPDGKVVFRISMPTPGQVRVAVHDTGMGIPADKQDKLFQPFQRAGQETGAIEGTGIGLVISRRLAQLMGGEIGFRSVAGEGSEFWVDIPAHDARAPSNEPMVAAADTGSGRLVAGGHALLLYVEDNPANIRFMQDLVSTFDGLELVTASSAEAGVELACARRPEVIIMDINLPGSSGLEALRVLRATPETSKIPVIALTGAASERDQQRGIQAGFHQYLTKPVKVGQFVAALQAVLPQAG